MKRIAWVNGHFLPLEQATVHVEDRGFQFGDGVYEVIACLHGHFLDMDAHLQRLEASCHAIYMDLPMKKEELASLLQEAYRRNPFTDAMIYIQITRGTTARTHLATHPLQPTVVVTVRALHKPSEDKFEQGVDAITREDIRWKRCNIKTISLLATVIGKQEAALAGASETLWRNADQHILEGCSSNCFAIIQNTLVTHPLDHQVLGGITRNMTLKLAKEHAIRVEERPWRLHERGLSECMISSTTQAILPVFHIDQMLIGDGTPGPFTRKLRGWLLETFEALKNG